jgi:methylthioribose-1-phosphate isomerase
LRKTGEEFRTIWLKPGNPQVVQIIDQRLLPHEYVIADLSNWRDGAVAISDMLVRGAPLIGATAAWSLYLAALEYSSDQNARDAVLDAADALGETRPTAVNLRWALDRMRSIIRTADSDDLAERLAAEASAICDEDVEISRGIGLHGLGLIEEIAERKAQRLRPSISRMPKESMFTSGSTKPGPVTRARS